MTIRASYVSDLDQVTKHVHGNPYNPIGSPKIVTLRSSHIGLPDHLVTIDLITWFPYNKSSEYFFSRKKSVDSNDKVSFLWKDFERGIRE